MTGDRRRVRPLCTWVLLTACLSGGCASNGLIQDLAACNISRHTTAWIELHGDESTVGPRVHVVIRDRDVLDAIWAKLHRSYSDSLWYASGYRKIEFYGGPDGSKPDAVLLLNESDLAFVPSAGRWRYDEATERMTGGYRCEGLHELVMAYLEAQLQRDKFREEEKTRATADPR